MRRAVGWLIASAVVFVTVGPGARAVEFSVQSQTVGDAYQLVTSDDELLNRRRLHQYLGLGLHDLTSDGSNQLRLVTMFRFDGDFGLTERELDDIEMLRQHQLTIQTAVLEGRGVAGFLDFDLGRFLNMDAMDYLMVDGARVLFKLPWSFGIEVLAGLETKHDMAVVNSTQQELDGVRVISDNTGPGAGVTNDEPTVILGVSLVTHDFWFTRFRIGYRRMFSDGEIDSEKVGLSFFHRFGKRVFFSTSESFDLVQRRPERLDAQVRWQITDWFGWDVQYVHLKPTFDADSIFNIFQTHPLNDANTRLRFHIGQDATFYVGGMVRFFGNEEYTGNSAVTIDTTVEAYGAMLGYFHTFGPKVSFGFDASYEDGFGGRRIFGDVRVRYSPLPRQLDFDVRLTGVHFDDDLQPNLDGLSFGYQLGAKYTVDERAAISLVGEHNFNRIHTSQLRLFAVLDLNFFL